MSQYHWSHLHIKPGFPPGMSPFSSGLAGSLSSSLHENYSMGELKECGVHSVEQLAECHIHSFGTQRVQEAQAREVEGQQKLTSSLVSLETMIHIRLEGICFIRTSEYG